MVLLQIISEIKKLTLSDWLVFAVIPILIASLLSEKVRGREKINQKEIGQEIMFIGVLSFLISLIFAISLFILNYFKIVL